MKQNLKNISAHSYTVCYTKTNAPEQIINDIISYNEAISENNCNITLFFQEFVGNIDRRIGVTYITDAAITVNHCHDFYEIIYVYKGEILQYINGKSFSLTDGNLMILHPSVAHSFFCYKDTKAVNILVKKEYLERFSTNIATRIQSSFLNRVIEEKDFAIFRTDKSSDTIKPFVDSLCRFSELFTIERHLLGVETSYSYDVVDSVLSEQVLQQLLLTIIKEVNCGSISEKIVSTNRVSSDTSEIIAYIRENYTTVTIDDVAKKFGYSASQIYRIIKHSTGNNFNNVVMTIRMSRARYLLRNTDYTAIQIAKMLGLESAEYFSRFFKQQAGCTPIQYRINHRT